MAPVYTDYVARTLFLPPSLHGKATEDRPVHLNGKYHQSAPHIYNEVLKYLDLDSLGENIKFLNVGSGTGWLSAIVWKICGGGVHHGVEIEGEMVSHSRECLKKVFPSAPFNIIEGNAYNIDRAQSEKYNRIYVSAAVDQDEINFFLGLLEVGGKLVVPSNSQLFLCIKTSNSSSLSSCARVMFSPLKKPITRRKFPLPPFPSLPSFLSSFETKDRDILDAFTKVDRQHFLPPSLASSAYENSALHDKKDGFHHSSPHLYAAAVEALRLKEGEVRVLNVGSGTGYLSTIMYVLANKRGIHHGVEINSKVHSFSTKAICRYSSSSEIYLLNQNIFLLDSTKNIKYNRMYIGSGITNAQWDRLVSLLDVGGIAVAPCSDSLKVFRKISENNVVSRELSVVRFRQIEDPPVSSQSKFVIQLAPSFPSSSPSSTTLTVEDLKGMKVKELKRVAGERGVDLKGLIEKEEIIQAIAQTLPIKSEVLPSDKNQDDSKRNVDELLTKLKKLEEENTALKEENSRLKTQITSLQISTEVDGLVSQLEKVGEEVKMIRHQVANHTTEEEKAKIRSKIALERLFARSKNGEDIRGELEKVTEERERREKKQKELQESLGTKLRTEKLLIGVIEEKLKQQERNREEQLERERLVAEKVIEIARLENRIKYELPLDPTQPSFADPFPVSFLMVHHSASFLPTYQKENFFSLTSESLANYEKYVTFKDGGDKVTGTIRPGPFAKGGFRYAYFGMISEGLSLGGTRERGEQVVMKHLMDVYDDGAVGELRDLRECTLSHLLGRRVVEEFKKKAVKDCGSVVMVRCEVLEWATPKLKGYPRKFWTAEPYLPGKFMKFNNNNGKEQNNDYPLAQALSHFSCYLFNGNLIMLDIQGCVQGDNLILTDPAFSSPTGKGFGEGNLKEAIGNFFQEHKCTWICHALMGEGAKKNLVK